LDLSFVSGDAISLSTGDFVFESLVNSLQVYAQNQQDQTAKFSALGLLRFLIPRRQGPSLLGDSLKRISRLTESLPNPLTFTQAKPALCGGSGVAGNPSQTGD
jgi:hypothetical protein